MKKEKKMENLFLEIIFRAKQHDKLVAIYTDKDEPNTFSVGYIVYQLEEGLILNSIDTNGFDDGLMFMCLLDIYLIEIDTIYLKNLEIVNKSYSKFNDFNSIFFKRNKDEILINDFLNKCLSDKKIVTISLFFGKNITGFINKISDDMIVLNIITSEGENNGTGCIKIEEINRIYIDGIEQRRITILLENKANASDLVLQE